MSEDNKYGEWAVKSAAETLVRAEEIKKDEKLMALVKGELEKSAKAIKSIKELRNVAAKMRAEEPEMEDEDEEEEEDVELRTEEDKAALQEKRKIDKNLEKFKS
jgi:hypothetical protein